jgi:UDP-glucose 4-epimerase
MAKKCLILGGGGFIGSAVAERLLADDWALRIFERPGVQPHREFKAFERVEWMGGDYQSESDLMAALQGVDSVIHLISTMLPKSSNDAPVNDVQSNVVATLRLLNGMVALGVRRIVFASSGGTVYGVPKSVPISEDHCTEPEVSYGICKLMIEKYLYLYSRLHAIEPISLRIANPYGGRQRADTAQGAIAAFLHRALSGEPLEIWGDGSVTRDYLHVSDVAEAFLCALRYQGARQIFNIGSGVGVNLNELVETIEFVLGQPVERRYLPGRSFDVPVSILDNSLARAELNWVPRISLKDGLRLTLPAPELGQPPSLPRSRYYEAG